MLLELSIRDFAIIDELCIGFEPGLNALTGETGAGKSILIDALGAVLGERVGAAVVRTGASAARVEATFDIRAVVDRPDVAATLDELGVEPDDGLLIFSRDILASGRSSARINGRTVTAGMLARLGSLLVDIHGQSDHLSLLRPAEHLAILDRYGNLQPARGVVADRVRELRDVEMRIRDLTGNERQRAQREDFLRYQIDEINAVNPSAAEEETLSAERTVLANTERLALGAARAYALLSGSDEVATPDAMVPALHALRQASEELAAIAAVDESMQPLAARLDDALYSLEDLSSEVRSYGARIEADPARLGVIEDRLSALRDLKRKYGATIEEVLAAREEASRELAEMTGEEGGLDALRERERRLREEAGAAAAELSRARARAGEALADAADAVMAQLNMGRAQFAVSLTQVPDAGGVPFPLDGDRHTHVAIDTSGIDRVEFLIAPNAGEALKPLGRVASGGEMARLMLALKSILSEADATPTLVFDEVDVGVGGRSGQVVGEKLWGLARRHQVLVITHLAQVAAFAETHFRIAKEERSGRVVSRVAPIADDERAEELAAMIDGFPVTPGARQSALDMRDRVQAWKARSETKDAATVG